MYTHHPNATREQRETFEKLCGGKAISRNLLSLANVLSVRKGKFDFKIQKDGTNQLPCETRLEMSDAFYVCALQIVVQKFEKDKNGVPTIPVSEEMTFACPTAFPGIVGKVKEAQSVRTVWDAIISFGNRSKVRLPEQNTKQFLFTKDNFFDTTRGFVMLDTPLFLKGNETDTFTLVLPDYLQDAIEGNIDANAKETNTVNVVKLNALGYWCVDFLKNKTA